MGGIVIIGAGQAGASLAAKLRALGYQRPITLIGEEAAPPYQRPPLSKGYLLGEMELERLHLRAPAYWEQQGIELKLGALVTEIDRSAKTVRVENQSIAYDQLALTTGSSPRQLPASIGGKLKGVYTVRTLADADRMAPEFRSGRRLLIIGGGYVGLEAAAVGAKLGLDITLVEMAPRILQRVASPATADYIRKIHERHGVKILENVGLDRLIGRNSVTGAVLSNGREIKVDFAIVGIGIVPCSSLAEKAGLVINHGISTDEFGRTSDPSIWAAGDCASFPYRGKRIRLESVGNAIDHAEIVAENMLGAQKIYEAKPWFWSNQYNIKLQIAGLNTGYDCVVTRQGKDDAISFWYYRDSALIALDSVNDTRAYMVGKRLIERDESPDPIAIANPALDLRTLIE